MIELTPDGELVNHKKDKYDLYKVSICRDELTIEIPGIKDILKDLNTATTNKKLLTETNEENRKLKKDIKELNKKIITLTNTINSKIAIIAEAKSLLKRDEDIFKTMLPILKDTTDGEPSKFLQGIISNISKAISRN